MSQHPRRIAIVCHPWDKIATQSGSIAMIIAGELARRFARDWHVTLYGQRGPKQKRQETDADGIVSKRFPVFRKPHALLEILVGMLSSYTKRRINLFLLPLYHLCYAMRVAFSMRAAKCEAVLILDFLQFASVIKLLNPSATVCLQMHCEWLTQYATTASERRLRAVDLIFGCSDYITEGIRKRFPAIAARCHTVYNGVDTDFFCPSPAEPATKDLTEDLLYVGRMSPEKGVHVLIQAFKILAESRSLLRLHLVGPASMLPYLTLCPDRTDAAIASLEVFYGHRLSEMVSRQLSRRDDSYLDDLVALAGLDQRIIFHGAVSHRETIDFYRRAVMLVFPSVANETFGVPPIEAMACGLPVVSTYAGGIPEIVEHGRTGLLVGRGEVRELAEAIGQLLDDPARARAMGTAGRQRVVERFTWDASARRLAELIEGVPFSASQRDNGAEEKAALVCGTTE